MIKKKKKKGGGGRKRSFEAESEECERKCWKHVWIRVGKSAEF